MPILPFSRHRLRAGLLLPILLSLALSAAAKPADWSAEIEHFVRADAAQPPAPGAVVFVGSSSIRRWTTLPEDFPGLAIVNRIVSEHHGSIRVEENFPIGTKFVIELPVDRAAVPSTDEPVS